MTKAEMYALIVEAIAVVLANILLFKKKSLYENKNLEWYFVLAKATVIAPVVFTGLQLYVFNFTYVGAIGCSMYHFVFYCYIGYLLLAGFALFLEDYNVKLMLAMSVLIFLYQAWMGSILISNKEVLMVLMESPYNPFMFGDSLGTLVCLGGPIGSFFGVLTMIHYWKANNKTNFI